MSDKITLTKTESKEKKTNGTRGSRWGVLKSKLLGYTQRQRNARLKKERARQSEDIERWQDEGGS